MLRVEVNMLPWRPSAKQMENDAAFQLESGCTLPPSDHSG